MYMYIYNTFSRTYILEMYIGLLSATENVLCLIYADKLQGLVHVARVPQGYTRNEQWHHQHIKKPQANQKTRPQCAV